MSTLRVTTVIFAFGVLGCAVYTTPPPDSFGGATERSAGQPGESPEATRQPPPGPTSHRVVFLTERAVEGHSIGGVRGADRICQAEAQRAGLEGRFMAWISDSRTSPSIRFQRSNVPYVLTNNDVVAQNWDDLVDGSLPQRARIAVTASRRGVGGDEAGDCRVWTGTLADGSANLQYGFCGDWSERDSTGGIGFWDSPENRGQCDAPQEQLWSGGEASNRCDQSRRLYCFQQ